MTVYPRRKAHLVPEHPRRLRRHLPEKDTAMKQLTATVKCGRRTYEASINLPQGALGDPHAMEALKNRLRLMIAHDIIGKAPIEFRTERLGVGSLRRVK